MAKDDERRELSHITFVFETSCTADCTLHFLAVRKNMTPYNFLHLFNEQMVLSKVTNKQCIQ